MTVSIPDSVLAEGNVKVVFVPTLASLTLPSAAALNAGIDISCYLMPDWDGATANQNTGESRRFCSRRTFGKLGRVQWTLAPLIYTYLPQLLGTPGSPGNEVYEALLAGNTGVVGFGYGIEPEEEFVEDDVVDLFPVETGAQSKGARGADEFAPLTVTQTLAVNGVEALDRVLAA